MTLNTETDVRLMQIFPEDVYIHSELWDDDRRTINWLLALERLKQSKGIVEEKEFAKYLDIPSSTLSDVRRRKMEINPRIKCQLLDFLGFKFITTVLQLLRNEEQLEVVHRATLRQARKTTASNAAKTSD